MAKYIDSEKAIDACFNGWNNNAHDCAENIRSIPAADVVERKAGKWIHDTLGEAKMPIVKCSECGLKEVWYEVEGMGFALYGQKYANFCPNCGAKMEVPTDV